MEHSPKLSRNRGPKTIKVDPEHILDAAQRVFALNGIHGSSLRAISKEAGCDPALIYYHFENKEAVFVALLDRKFPSLVEDIERLCDASDERPSVERLWDVIRTMQRHFAQDAGFRATIRGEMARGADGIKDTIAQRVKPLFQALSGLFQQGIARGEVRPDLPLAFGAFFFARFYLELLDLVPVMAERIAGISPELALPAAELAWFELFWRGVAANPAAASLFLDTLKESRP